MNSVPSSKQYHVWFSVLITKHFMKIGFRWSKFCCEDCVPKPTCIKCVSAHYFLYIYICFQVKSWIWLFCANHTHHTGTHILHWQADEGKTILMSEISIAHGSTAFPSLLLHCTNHKSPASSFSYWGKGKSQCLCGLRKHGSSPSYEQRGK